MKFSAKNLLAVLLSFMSLSSYASLKGQMSGILGNWDCGKGSAVLKVQKQDNDSVKFYNCDRVRYLSEGRCFYFRISLASYDASTDSFCVKNNPFCSSSLQVSEQYPSEMLEIIDPLNLYNYYNSGNVVAECKKI